MSPEELSAMMQARFNSVRMLQQQFWNEARFVPKVDEETTGEENLDTSDSEETPPPPPPPPQVFSPYNPTAYVYDPSAESNTSNTSSNALTPVPFPPPTSSHPTLFPSITVSTSVPIPDRGHHPSASRTTKKDMDPFEVRIRFTQQLQQLNASVTSANKAAQYALKFRDMDEDLHSCILEQLERWNKVGNGAQFSTATELSYVLKQNSMNNRANIMYFIEHLCDMAARENHTDYVRMMQRDILRVVDAVAPEDGSGAANVKVVRKVLQGLQTKSFLLPQTVLEIEELLKERDTAADAIPLSSPVETDVEMTGTGEVRSLKEKPSGEKIGGLKNGVGMKLDKKQVEQRIEEDRERHKRLRENIWAIPTAGGERGELEKTWEETSDFGEDDGIVIEEEEEERGLAMGDFKEEYREKIYAGGE